MAISSSKVVVLVTINYPLVKAYVGELPLTCTPEYSVVITYVGSPTDIPLETTPEASAYSFEPVDIYVYNTGELSSSLTPEHSEARSFVYINELPSSLTPEHSEARSFAYLADVGPSFSFETLVLFIPDSSNEWIYGGEIFLLSTPECDSEAITPIVFSCTPESLFHFNICYSGVNELPLTLGPECPTAIFSLKVTPVDINVSLTPESIYQLFTFSCVGNLEIALALFTNWDRNIDIENNAGSNSVALSHDKQFIVMSGSNCSYIWRNLNFSPQNSGDWDTVVVNNCGGSIVHGDWKFDDSLLLLGFGNSAKFYIYDQVNDDFDLDVTCQIPNIGYIYALKWNPVYRDHIAVAYLDGSWIPYVRIYRRDASSVSIIATAAAGSAEWDYSQDPVWCSRGKFVMCIDRNADTFTYKFDKDAGTLTLVSNNYYNGFRYFRFSPDGKYLVASYVDSDAWGKVGIFEIDYDTGTLTRKCTTGALSNIMMVEWTDDRDVLITCYNSIWKIYYFDDVQNTLTFARNFKEGTISGSIYSSEISRDKSLLIHQGGGSNLTIYQKYSWFKPSKGSAGTAIGTIQLSTTPEAIIVGPPSYLAYLEVFMYCQSIPVFRLAANTVEIPLTSNFESYCARGWIDPSIDFPIGLSFESSYFKTRWEVDGNFEASLSFNSSYSVHFVANGNLETTLTPESLKCVTRIYNGLTNISIYNVCAQYSVGFIGGTEFQLGVNFYDSFYFKGAFGYRGALEVGLMLSVDWELVTLNGTFVGCQFCNRIKLIVSSTNMFVADSWAGFTDVPPDIEFHRMRKRTASNNGQLSVYEKRNCPTVEWEDSAFDADWNYDDSTLLWATETVVDSFSGAAGAYFYSHDENGNYSRVETPHLDWVGATKWYQAVKWNPCYRNYFVVLIGSSEDSPGARIVVYRKDLNSVTQLAYYNFNIAASFQKEIRWDKTGHYLFFNSSAKMYVFKFDPNESVLTKTEEKSVPEANYSYPGPRLSPNEKYYLWSGLGSLYVYAFDKVTGTFSSDPIATWFPWVSPAYYSSYMTSPEWEDLTSTRILVGVTAGSLTPATTFELKFDPDKEDPTSRLTLLKDVTSVIGAPVNITRNNDLEYLVCKEATGGETQYLIQRFSRFFPSTFIVGLIDYNVSLESEYHFVHHYLGTTEIILTSESSYIRTFTSISSEFLVTFSFESVILPSFVYLSEFSVSPSFISVYGLSTPTQQTFLYMGLIDFELGCEYETNVELQISTWFSFEGNYLACHKFEYIGEYSLTLIPSCYYTVFNYTRFDFSLSLESNYVLTKWAFEGNLEVSLQFDLDWSCLETNYTTTGPCYDSEVSPDFRYVLAGSPSNENYTLKLGIKDPVELGVTSHYDDVSINWANFPQTWVSWHYDSCHFLSSNAGLLHYKVYPNNHTYWESGGSLINPGGVNLYLQCMRFNPAGRDIIASVWASVWEPCRFAIHRLESNHQFTLLDNYSFGQLGNYLNGPAFRKIGWDMSGQWILVPETNITSAIHRFKYNFLSGTLTNYGTWTPFGSDFKGYRFSRGRGNLLLIYKTNALYVYSFNRSDGSISLLASCSVPEGHTFVDDSADWVDILGRQIVAIGINAQGGYKAWIFRFNEEESTLEWERDFPAPLQGPIQSSYEDSMIASRYASSGKSPGVRQFYYHFKPITFNIEVGEIDLSISPESVCSTTVTNTWLGLFEIDLIFDSVYNLLHIYDGDLGLSFNLESAICRTQVFPTTWLFTSLSPQSLYRLTKFEYEGDISFELLLEGEDTASYTFSYISTMQLAFNLESIKIFDLHYLGLINLICNPESIYLKYEPYNFYEGLIQFSVTPNTISVIGTYQDFQGMDLRSAWGNKVSETTQADFETGILSGLEIVNDSLSLIWIEETFETNQSLDIIGGSLVVGYDLYFNIEAKELPEAPERLIKVNRLWSTFQPNKTGITKIYWRRGPYDPDAADWTLAGSVEMSSGNTLSETEIPIDINVEVAQGETLGIWIETEDPYLVGWEIAYSEGANIVKENDYINITTGRACLDPNQCGDWYYFEPASFTGIVKYDILKQEFLPFEGYRISPVYDLSSIGRYSSSRVVWDATVPSGTEMLVDIKVSEDGGIEWSDWINISNKGPLPVLNEWSKLNNIKLQYRVSFLTLDITKSPIFNEITFAVYSYMPIPITEPNIEILEAMSNQFDQGYLYNLVVESEGLLALDSVNGSFIDSGYRVSPTYVFLKPQRVNSSIVYWAASNPAGCSFKIESRVSIDGESWSGWEELENGSTIPNLPVNAFLQHAEIQFKQTFNSAVQPFWDATPFLDGLYVGLYTSDVPYIEIKEISEESFSQGELNNTEVVNNCLVLSQDNITDGPFNLNLRGIFKHYAYNGSIIQLIPDADITIQGIWLQFIETGNTHVKVYYREDDGVIYDDGKWNLVISKKFNISLEKTLTYVPSNINLTLNEGKEYLMYITTTETNIKCHQHSVTDFHNEPGLKIGSVQAFNYKFKDRLDGYCFTGIISYTRNRDRYTNNGYRVSPVYSFGSLGQIPIDTIIEWSANIPENSSLNIQTRISTDSGVTWLPWMDVDNGSDIPHLSSALRIGSVRLQIREIMNSNEMISPKLEWVRVRAYLYDGSSITEDIIIEDLTHDFEIGNLEDTLAQNDSLELSTSPGVGYRPNLIYTDFRNFEIGFPVTCTPRFNTGVDDPTWTIINDSEYTGGKYLTRE